MENIWKKTVELLEIIIEIENSVNGFNHRLDTAEELVNWKTDVKKLPTMQHREADREIIIEVYWYGEHGRSFNTHITEVQKERNEWIEKRQYLKRKWLGNFKK